MKVTRVNGYEFFLEKGTVELHNYICDNAKNQSIKHMFNMYNALVTEVNHNNICVFIFNKKSETVIKRIKDNINELTNKIVIVYII